MTSEPYDGSVNPLNLDPSRTWLTRDEAAVVWRMSPDAFSSEVAKDRAPKPGGRVGRTPMWDEEILRVARVEADKARPGRGNWGPREGATES